VNYQDRLVQARQGNAAAIATLLQQALATRGIQVRAICQDKRLHVLLEADQVPDRQIYTRAVYAALLCLGAQNVYSVRIYGRETHASQPTWTQSFTVKQLVLPALLQPPIVEKPPIIEKQSVEKQSKSPVVSQPAKSKPTINRSRQAKLRRRPKLKTPAFVSSQPLSSKANDYRSGLPFLLIVGASLGIGLGANALLNGRETGNPAATAKLTIPETPAPIAPSPIAAPNPQSELPIAPPAAQTQQTITIKAVGDLIPGSNATGSPLPADVGEALAGEKQLLFGNIKAFLGEADITFGNFESTLTDYPYSAKDTSQNMTFAFRTPPVYAQMLKDVGFDVLSVANNHSMDFGEQGFEDTIANINQTGMKAVGKKGQILYLEVNQVPIAFIGFSYLDYHNSINDLESAAALVQEAKQKAKIVVISVHAGAEGSDQTHVSNQTEYFYGENRGNLVQFARFVIDQGASLVLGHGPHVPRAVELYQGKLIAYSLGNFMGYGTLSTEGALGYSLILQAQLDTQGGFVGGRVLPVALDRNGIPYLDDYFQSVILVRNMTQNNFPQTPLAIDDMGYIVRTDQQQVFPGGSPPDP
jgi:hypothetical protein